MNSITTLQYTHKELAERFELKTSEFIDICVENNLLIRNKGKVYFICDDSYYDIIQNEINGIPFKQYFWSERGLKYLENLFR